MDGGDWQASWAHRLWQTNGLRMEDFAAMEFEQQCAYIASYELERKRPVNRLHALIDHFFK